MKVSCAASKVRQLPDVTTFISAYTAQQFPKDPHPEYAFLGRSNVGKSSLINALVNKKKLARTSKTPGRTQLIMFFEIPSLCRLVDLPGYGYAKISKSERQRFEALIKTYLAHRPFLRRLFLLIDSRVGLKELDIEWIEWMTKWAVPIQLIFTKCDKVKKAELEALLASCHLVQRRAASLLDSVVLTSAHDKTGLDDLRSIITKLS